MSLHYNHLYLQCESTSHHKWLQHFILWLSSCDKSVRTLGLHPHGGLLRAHGGRLLHGRRHLCLCNQWIKYIIPSAPVSIALDYMNYLCNKWIIQAHIRMIKWSSINPWTQWLLDIIYLNVSYMCPHVNLLVNYERFNMSFFQEQ